MTIRKLIEAVERGEYHDRADGIPRFNALYDALKETGYFVMARPLSDAMHKGPAATAATLRAQEADE